MQVKCKNLTMYRETKGRKMAHELHTARSGAVVGGKPPKPLHAAWLHTENICLIPV